MKTKIHFTLPQTLVALVAVFAVGTLPSTWAQKASVATSTSTTLQASPPKSTASALPASKNEEDDIDELAASYPVSTKLKATRCVELEESEDKSILIASFDHSRLSFNLSSSDKDFQKFKVILVDACQNKKRVDLRYEASSQKIVMLRFSKK